MRIHDIIVESHQVDEVTWKDVKKGVAATGKAAQSALSGVGKAAGYVAGIPQGLGRAAKQGYSAAVNGIGGPAPADTAQGMDVDQAKADPRYQNDPEFRSEVDKADQFSQGFQSQTGQDGASPKQVQQSKVGVGQINKLIPTLRNRDLQSVKKTVDATLAKRTKPAATKPGLQVQQGGKAPAANPNQAELDADQARMASGTNESKKSKTVVEFYSNFLGKML